MKITIKTKHIEPEKSLCDTCKKPGVCCSRFVLSMYTRGEVVTRHDFVEKASKFANRHSLPFVPSGTYTVITNPEYTDSDYSRVEPHFSCPKLGIDGRCTDYENRPPTCRYYRPASDTLCIMHPGPRIRGIPILTVTA